jgi:hypothetical protein
MTTPPRQPSSGRRLRRLLAETPGPPGDLYRTEAQYHAPITYTSQLLDIVDAFTDEPTAALITAAIYERLTGTAADEAAQRLHDARDTYERLMGTARPRQR